MKRTPRAKNKKPFIAIAAISAIAIIGGSFAYFRYTESFDNDFKLGVATTSFTETFESPSDWTPCTETPKTLAITNTSTFAINARIKITERWEKLDENGNVIANETLPLKVDNKAMAIINFANPSDWVLNSADGYYYYQGDIAPDNATSSFINSVTFNCDANSAYSSARYHLILQAETVEAKAAARENEGWNY